MEPLPGQGLQLLELYAGAVEMQRVHHDPHVGLGHLPQQLGRLPEVPHAGPGDKFHVHVLAVFRRQAAQLPKLLRVEGPVIRPYVAQDMPDPQLRSRRQMRLVLPHVHAVIDPRVLGVVDLYPGLLAGRPGLLPQHRIRQVVRDFIRQLH